MKRIITALLLSMICCGCAMKHGGCYNTAICIPPDKSPRINNDSWFICGIEVDAAARTIMPTVSRETCLEDLANWGNEEGK